VGVIGRMKTVYVVFLLSVEMELIDEGKGVSHVITCEDMHVDICL